MTTKRRARRKNLKTLYTDVFFACPVCGKNMVTDANAQGKIVDCAQCQQKVIVPVRPDPTIDQQTDLIKLLHETGEEWKFQTKAIQYALQTLCDLQESQFRAAQSFSLLAQDIAKIQERLQECDKKSLNKTPSS
jgi:transcription elongation factor Elf1